MVNLLPYEARDGQTVLINQVQLETPEGVAAAAKQLGFSVAEFHDRYRKAQGEQATEQETIADTR